MNFPRGTSFGRTNVGTGSLNSMREDGQWDDLAGRDHISVRTDFSMEGERQVDQEGGQRGIF